MYIGQLRRMRKMHITLRCCNGRRPKNQTAHHKSARKQAYENVARAHCPPHATVRAPPHPRPPPRRSPRLIQERDLKNS